MLLRNLRAQMLQPRQVEVNRTRADRASARIDTRARPARATRGPSTRLDARIVFTSS